MIRLASPAHQPAERDPEPPHGRIRAATGLGQHLKPRILEGLGFRADSGV